jgi:hypothetical protein
MNSRRTRRRVGPVISIKRHLPTPIQLLLAANLAGLQRLNIRIVS